MPHLSFRRETDDRNETYFAEKSSRRATNSTKLCKNSCLSNFQKLFCKKKYYDKLPHHLKSCLDYISIINFCKRHELVRLLLAEGLIPDRSGESMEDVAENIIDELIQLGLLVEERYLETLEVVEPYNNICSLEVDEHKFMSKAQHLPVHAVVNFDESSPRSIDFKNLRICSLSLNARVSWGSRRGLSLEFMQDICKLQFLVVLRIFAVIESIPDEVGNLVNLKYLELAMCVNLDNLPRTLGNLLKLQTLELSYSGKLRELPADVLELQQLRHLLLGDVNDLGVRVPKGIGKLVNLQTCYGVCAGYGIANELATLTQLRRFGANCVSEGHSTELAAAIMNMQNLLSLSLQAEDALVDGEYRGVLPQFENFSPPHLIQELNLRGALIEIPSWVASMENLTSLTLYKSNLSQDEVSLLQHLPKLKYLYLQEAYDAKIIGKEFCEAGGFPKLETLKFVSEHLVEWAEIVNRAFPSLRYLVFRGCVNFRFVTEDLQNISTLQELTFWAVHEDLVRQLQGKDRHKVKRIPKVNYFPLENYRRRSTWEEKI
ncbi:disease resistance protein RPM1-like [Mercurialis annua]|uniref:disease resistance protein RPM1-like n=1 Tax=Mercurialis annua TaxID=3986 RepID=UPI00215EFFC3|nr:disease resistance protein RPM1-like [Mercurialis annua]